MGQTGFLGEIRIFAGNFAPRGWAFCEGQILPIAQNTALFSILGTIYGGDGRTTFALPDLRGRAPISPGTGPGLPTYRLGEKGGSFQNTVNVNQLPSHNHILGIQVNTEEAEESSPSGYLASSTNYNEDPSNGAYLGGVSMGNSGGNQPMDNMGPYLTANYIIALTGTYPSRS